MNLDELRACLTIPSRVTSMRPLFLSMPVKDEQFPETVAAVRAHFQSENWDGTVNIGGTEHHAIFIGHLSNHLANDGWVGVDPFYDEDARHWVFHLEYKVPG